MASQEPIGLWSNEDSTTLAVHQFSFEIGASPKSRGGVFLLIAKLLLFLTSSSANPVFRHAVGRPAHNQIWEKSKNHCDYERLERTQPTKGNELVDDVHCRGKDEDPANGNAALPQL